MRKSELLTVAVAVSEDALKQQGIALATHLGLPFVDNGGEEYEYLLVKQQDFLELRHHKLEMVETIHLDFLSGKVHYRAEQSTRSNEAIAKACGLKKGKCPTIWDATAGFGEDGYILATLGCPVLMLERSPIVAALLMDAVSRAKARENITITVKQADSIAYMQAMKEERPDVVYLDPMFPPRKKSAMVKKKMQFLSLLAGREDVIENQALLTTALSVAKERVVVKRPKTAPFLAEKQPSMMIKTKEYRFDVYLVSFHDKHSNS